MTKLFELKNKLKLYPSIKLIFFECLCFALGFYLASVRFIFGIYPFGIAFLCANRRFSVFAYCGSLLCYAFLLDFNLPYIIALSCAFGLRIICSLIQKKDKHASVILGKKAQGSVLDTLFYENTSVRVAISCFTVLGLGVYFIIKSEFNFFEMFVTLFSLVLSGIFTFAFCGAFLGKDKRGFALSICALLFATLYGIRDLELWGLNICLIISCALVLYTSKYLSLSHAGALGILLGLCTGFAFAPCLAILGLISGFLWKTSSYLAIMSAFVVASAYGIFSSGYEAIIYLAPEMLLSCLLMYSFLRFEVLPVPLFVKSATKSNSELLIEKQNEMVRATLDNARGALDDISNMIKDLSRGSKLPNKQDYSALCLESCEEHCFSCPKYSICWEKDLGTTESNLNRLTSSALTNKVVNSKDVTEKFLHRCPNIDRIIERINEKISENRTQGIKNDKLEVCSVDYELASKILASACDKAFDCELCDHGATAKITRACAKLGFICDKIEVLGLRTKKIIAYDVDTERTKCTASALKGAFEKALGIKLTEPEFEIGAKTTMTLCSAKALEAKCVTVSTPSSSDEINGDSTACFESSESKFYAILCDGMGSGQSARLTSLLCTGFLQKLLKRGADKELSLMSLNNFVRARGKESSCTIDLLELDLITGNGKLLKSGAAPTFIKRGDNVFKLESKTMPIGIMKRLDAESHSFEIKQGDICIMLSDGVVCDEGDASHLIKLLKSTSIDDEGALCTKILNEMKPRHDHSDDMTVSVVSVL